MKNVMKVLYLSLLKALYVFVESTLLWDDVYTKTLKSQRLVANPYYRWISNSTIDGTQCKIAWNVDDNKVLHIDKHPNTRIFKVKAEKFGKIIVSRGNHYKFLGMNIEF